MPSKTTIFARHAAFKLLLQTPAGVVRRGHFGLRGARPCRANFVVRKSRHRRNDFSPASRRLRRFGPSGVIDPTNSSILGSSNDGPNGGQLAGGDGQQLAILSTRPDDATPNTPRSAFLLSQRTFGVQFGQSYILEVAIADSLGTTPPPAGANPGPTVDPAVGGEPGTAQIGFLFNNARNVATFDASNYAAEGTLRDFRFTFTPQESDMGQLRIYLGQSGTTGREVIGFDNVRLTVAPVPEPSTYAMMALGLGALGLITHRKRAT